MKKRYLLIGAIWLTILGFLVYEGQDAPAIKTITEDRTVTLQHETAQFTVDLTGRWQEIDETTMGMTLYQLEEDALIDIIMEVGGFGYYAPNEIAALFGEKIPIDINDFTLTDACTDEASNGERGYASFLYEGKDSILHMDLYIYMPIEGIRYYIAYLYPNDIKAEGYQEGLDIISSLTFYDLQSLYAAFL